MSNGKNTPVTPLTYKQCIDKYGAGAARCQSLKVPTRPRRMGVEGVTEKPRK